MHQGLTRFVASSRDWLIAGDAAGPAGTQEIIDEIDDGDKTSLGPSSPTPFPATLQDLIFNVLYIVERDLTLQDDFYERDSLTRLLGATDAEFNCSRPPNEFWCSFRLTFAPNPPVIGATSLPGSGGRVTKKVLDNGKSVVTLIHVQISGPLVRRPTYDEVEALVRRRWKPAKIDAQTPPHGQTIVSPYVLHGDAKMTLDVQTIAARTVITFDFDSSAQLLDFSAGSDLKRRSN